MSEQQRSYNQRAFDHWKIAHPRDRILAFLLDISITGTLIGSTFALLNTSFYLKSLILYWIVLLWTWEGFWTSFLGYTPGKYFFGVRIYSPQLNDIPNPLQISLRILMFWISFVLIGLGLTPILFRQDRRGWHDLISETVVIGEAKHLPGRFWKQTGRLFLLIQALLVFSVLGGLLLSIGIKEQQKHLLSLKPLTSSSYCDISKKNTKSH